MSVTFAKKLTVSERQAQNRDSQKYQTARKAPARVFTFSDVEKKKNQSKNSLSTLSSLDQKPQTTKPVRSKGPIVDGKEFKVSYHETQLPQIIKNGDYVIENVKGLNTLAETLYETNNNYQLDRVYSDQDKRKVVRDTLNRAFDFYKDPSEGSKFGRKKFVDMVGYTPRSLRGTKSTQTLLKPVNSMRDVLTFGLNEDQGKKLSKEKPRNQTVEKFRQSVNQFQSQDTTQGAQDEPVRRLENEFFITHKRQSPGEIITHDFFSPSDKDPEGKYGTLENIAANPDQLATPNQQELVVADYLKQQAGSQPTLTPQEQDSTIGGENQLSAQMLFGGGYASKSLSQTQHNGSPNDEKFWKNFGEFQKPHFTQAYEHSVKVGDSQMPYSYAMMNNTRTRIIAEIKKQGKEVHNLNVNLRAVDDLKQLKKKQTISQYTTSVFDLEEAQAQIKNDEQRKFAKQNALTQREQLKKSKHFDDASNARFQILALDAKTRKRVQQKLKEKLPAHSQFLDVINLKKPLK